MGLWENNQEYKKHDKKKGFFAKYEKGRKSELKERLTCNMRKSQINSPEERKFQSRQHKSNRTNIIFKFDIL